MNLTTTDKIVYYCDGMKVFGDSMIKYMGYRRYTPEDVNKEVFFEGLYFQQDYNVLNNHKGKCIVYWNGSDVKRLIKNPQWQEIVKSKDITHLCQSKISVEELKTIGIESTHYPIFFGDINKYQVSYKHSNNPQVVLNSHPGRWKEYGVDTIEEIAPQLPDVTFHIYGSTRETTNPNVIYHGWVEESVMDEELKGMQCVIKGDYSGISQTMTKAGLMGLYVISMGEADFAYRAETKEELISQINTLKDMKEPNMELRNNFLQYYNMDKKDLKISVSMIVKNEQAVLKDCLETVKGFDEIVIIDTGSTDDTIKIAKEYTDKVYTDYKWEDHFANARNISKDRCTGDWILIIDADETLHNTVEEVRKVVEEADKIGANLINVKTISSRGSDSHKSQRLIRNIPEVKWYGAAHNYLGDSSRPLPPKHPSENEMVDIKVVYGYSPAHKLDPDRTLRILKKAVEEGAGSREIFYLAREYYYRRDYRTCVKYLEKYLEKPGFRAEIAEVHLMMARCYWSMEGDHGEDARLACMRAIYISPDFKEAFVFMAEMNFEPRKSKWLLYSKLADSKDDVLFVRDMSGAYKL